MFSPEERKVFRYCNGQGEVFADPLMLQRKLRVAMGGDPKKVVEEFNSDNPIVSDQAAEVFYGGIREAFGIQPFNPADGTGFVEEDLKKLWDMFQKWIDEKKNPTVNSPTASPSMAPAGLPRMP